MTDEPTTQAGKEAEEEVAAGLLPFTINGQRRYVPELKWRANRAWKAKLQATFAALATVPADTPDGMAAMAEAELELILAYDETHALGDLEDATETEIDAIYTRLMEVAYPQAQSRTAVTLMLFRLAAESVRASSTSGPSPAGASPPTILRDHLPSARSSSSSRRPKPASSVSARAG